MVGGKESGSGSISLNEPSGPVTTSASGRVLSPPQKPPAQVARVMETPAHTQPKARRRVRTAKAANVAPTDVDWERALAEWFPAETRRERRGSQSEVAMQIQTSDPDVVILWLKEERFQ